MSSKNKPEALFLAHRIPYPPDKGDKIRSWHLLRHLCSTHAVHLGAFVDDRADMAHEGLLGELCASVNLVAIDPRLQRAMSLRGFLTGEPLSMPYYRSPAMAQWVQSVRRLPLDLEVAYSSTMAPYLRHDARCPRLVDIVDADSEKWRQYAAAKAPPMRWVYAREGRRLAREEAQIASWADRVFLVSEAERDTFLAATGATPANVDWWGNGVDTAFFDPAAVMATVDEPADLVFTGAMDYWANVEAVTWFANEVWPRIRASAPALRLAVVGARPAEEVRRLGRRDGIEVTGRVPDVRPYIAAAAVSVAPLRIARGVQNKVLEAMSMGRAVVATPEAATGLAAGRDGELVIAATAEQFADAVLALLRDPQRRAAIGAAARRHVLDAYSWGRCLRRFDAGVEAARHRAAGSAVVGASGPDVRRAADP